MTLIVALGLSPSVPFSRATSRAEDFLGAEKIVETAAARIPEVAAKLHQRRNQWRLWSRSEVTPAPAKTAKAWLALYEKSIRPISTPLIAVENVSVNALLQALPPPEEWEALKKEILARPEASGREVLREIGLRLLGDVLTGDQADFERNLAAAQSFGATPGPSDGQPPSDYVVDSFIIEVKRAQLKQSRDPAETLSILNNILAVTERNLKRYSPIHFDIPDVVSMIGEEKAADYLRRVLLSPDLQIELNAGEETVRLAQKIALEQLASLKSAPWGLVQSVNDAEFYETLKTRFLDVDDSVPELLRRPVDPSARSRMQVSAQNYYILALIAQGRVEEATEEALKIGGDDSFSIPGKGLEALTRAGHRKAVVDFLRQLLAQKPALPLWSDYITLAIEAGEAKEMLSFLRHTLAVSKEDEEVRSKLQTELASALLAADQIDDGIKEMQQVLAALTSPDAAPLDKDRFAERLSDATYMAYKLVEIGILLERKPIIEDGLEAMRQIIDRFRGLSTRHAESYIQETTFSLAELLSKLKQHAEAEAVLAKRLEEVIASQSKNSDAIDNSTIREIILTLIAFYHHVERPAEIVVLVDKAPFWGGVDLAEYYRRTVTRFMPGNTSAPVGHIVASALAATGRLDEARVINRAVLDTAGACDPAYELLLKLDGPKAITRLDTLYSRDRFEERPLIWKAQLLFTSKKLEEAEATIREAIAIDPSDGESSTGERMRAYAVLADIREARGDKKEADFYREVVKAIRLSEQADHLKHVGLLTRSIAMYKEALTHFSDAYCIQSRLARDLARAGRSEEASAHYRRAFELMPDSFGRVESHCFGCEQAFKGEEVQSIAEEIFKEAILKTPDKPQVHYLLGYLRTEQGRHRDAVACYLTATKLDPDYLNAWKQIRNAAGHVHLSRAIQDEAALAMLRLDPLNRHSSQSGLHEVSNLRLLWQAVDTAARHQPDIPSTLYPLAASKAFLERSGEKSGSSDRSIHAFYSHTQQALTPSQAIGRHDLISPLKYLLQ